MIAEGNFLKGEPANRAESCQAYARKVAAYPAEFGRSCLVLVLPGHEAVFRNLPLLPASKRTMAVLLFQETVFYSLARVRIILHCMKKIRF